ncbi:MAG: hypothetical protein AAGB31_12020, partial [Bdellovibrio sp.]
MTASRSENPCIYNHSNSRDYLLAYYKHKKEMLPGFSYEAWAQELGYKSRSYLKMIVSGER